jgi:hypothetical protein
MQGSPKKRTAGILLSALACSLLATAGAAAGPPPRKHTNLQRLSLERLAAAHADVERLQRQRVDVPPRPGLTDYRCVLHAHAEDSDHTGGTLTEMLADAKRAGVHAILLSDHYRPPRDFIDGRWRGLRDGVLFIPGAEVHGFLAYPTKSILKRMDLKGADFVDTVTADTGLIFLSHVEERKDHPVTGLIGLEVYNRHYDARRDKASLVALALMLTDPKQLADLEEALRLYPDEAFALQCDYPDVYLRKWDEGTRRVRLTGIAANDCHHNQVFVVKVADAEAVLIGTNVEADDKKRKVTAALRPGVREMTKGKKPGDVIARLDFDPYHRSFRNVCTHVLAPRLDEPSVRAALRAGHAYVAFDWMCDATGLRFEAADAAGRVAARMGDEVRLSAGLRLTARLPLPAHVRLLRHGVEVARSKGKAGFEYAVTEAGAYRLEAWLELDGEWRPWVFTNPVYVR